MSFNRLVYWSGIWNIGLALGVVFPPVQSLLGMQIPNPFWPWLVAGFLGYTAATLVIASRDVKAFRHIILSEGVLRFFAAAVLLTLGVRYVGGLASVMIAAGDIAWGTIYMLGLRKLK